MWLTFRDVISVKKKEEEEEEEEEETKRYAL